MSRDPPMNIIAMVALLSLQQPRPAPALPSPSGARNDMADARRLRRMRRAGERRVAMKVALTRQSP